MTTTQTSGPWLIDERRQLAKTDLAELRRSLASSAGPGARATGDSSTTVAVRLCDLLVHDNKALFGSANIRVDVLVVHGNIENPKGWYEPKTQWFHDVRDGDFLLQRDSKLLVFYGPVKHFLDIGVLVSRDTGQTDQLADLLTKHMKSTELQTAAGSLLALAGGPQAAAVTAAVGAAGVVVDVAYRILRQVTGSTIGLYRQSFLQLRDDFGIGAGNDRLRRHPAEGSYRERGFSFWYEVTDETPRP